MKNWFKHIMLIGFFLFSQGLSAQVSAPQTFRVKGSCSMCKERIENTAKKAGATSAVWSSEQQTLVVEFDSTATSADKILKEIAAVGHDNERFSAPDAVYAGLPGCCHYERTTSILEKDTGTEAAKSNEFFVKGNCDMCKSRIEATAKQAGAEEASWNAATQKLALKFDLAKSSAEKILKSISEAGHDNELFRAPDAVYDKLPGCCHYDRKMAFGEKSDLVHSDSPQPATKDFTDFADHVDGEIDNVTVTKTTAPTALNKKNEELTFNISQKELLKAACCNLSESFETNATVDVSYSNAVTGTKQLKMLGLDQKYTSLTKELLPEIRGIASGYGLNFIPGRWIGGIQLTKGGSTVTNGYESITGQINTELLKYNGKTETTLNFFGDLNARYETNITNVSPLTDKWSQSILLHANATLGKKDHNHDGFLDQPTGNQVNAAYLLNYNDLQSSGWATHFGINFLKDERTAGQIDFNRHLPQKEQNAYGVGINTTRFQVWNKTGYIFKGKPYQSLGWMNQFTSHQQDSFFGLRDYIGQQRTFYSNLIFESIFGNTNHKYKTGASFLYDNFNEDYLKQNFKRTEKVPGLFFEYTLTGLKYVVVAGLRADFHNLAGTQFTPRFNFKYDITPSAIVRLSAGRGFRTANIFAENQAYLISNRTVQISPTGGEIYGLKPEIAWNYGASLQQEIKLFGRKSTIVADFFRTDFKDQVLTDLDASTHKILFYNLHGKSFANSFQTQWDFMPLKNFEVRAAYKYYDVQADYLNGRRQVPLMAKHRGFLNLAYATEKTGKEKFWSFDTTLNLVGKQRLPDTSKNPAGLRLPEYSAPFTTLNAQVARQLGPKTRLYAGAENITGYVQEKPILDAKNPFGNYFDAGMIYAPIMPTNIYLGLDLKF